MADDKDNGFWSKWGWKFKSTENDQKVQAGYVAPNNDDASFVVGSEYFGSYSTQLSFDNTIANESILTNRYRSIALQSEVDRAINEIINEMIDGSTEKDPIEIFLDKLDQPKSIKDKVQAEFDNICIALDFKQRCYEWVRKWYVDGKLHFHIIIDTANPDAGIQELRYISPLNIKKVKQQKTTVKDGIPVVLSEEEYFVYAKNTNGTNYAIDNTLATGAVGSSVASNALKIPADSIAYVDSGIIDDQKGFVYSYLQRSVRPCNLLRMEEDAVLIYSLSRAPMRRAFYVDVGNLPKSKAEEYLRNIQARYKNKLQYDSGTGEIKDQAYQMTMLEDFWLPRRENGKSTEIANIEGAGNLSSYMEPVDYFRKKLFESMGVPLGRLMTDASPGFTLGQSQTISREEVQFGAFIERLRKRFSMLFYDLLKKQLILKKVISPDEWDRDFKNNISFSFASNTYFEELKEMELLRERVTTVSMVDPRPVVGTYLSKNWVYKNIWKFSDDEVEDMQEDIDKDQQEEAELLQQQQQQMLGPQDPNSLLPQAPGTPEMGFNGSNFGGSPMKPTALTAPNKPKPKKQ